MCSAWGRTVWLAAGAGRGPGLTVIVVEGSHVPASVWPAAVVVWWGMDDGALRDGDVDEGLDGVVLVGLLCGGGGRWWEGAWVVVGLGSWFGLGFGLGRCRLGLCRCVCGVVDCVGRCWWWFSCCWCARLGTGLGLGSGFGLRSVPRLRRTSVRRCVGAGAGWGGFRVCCRGAWVACVGVGGSPVV